MIPLRLTVHNFMCYRDVPTLDLEGIHVACLCGDNGHGKTALLDAITWALWGFARARTQEELVHQGQQDMAVELEFMARGQRYRVSRRHSRSARARQGATVMELQVASENGFRPITGNSVRETEARIREILHMDYETFINTAFLRQGDADRFTTSTPAGRKATLAEVLDLSYYEALEERAKVKSRAIHDEIRNLDSAIALRRQEISQRPELEAELVSVMAVLSRIAPEAEAERVKVDDLRGKVNTLQGQRTELEDLAQRLADAHGDIAHLERQVRTHESKVGDSESALQREPEIREQFAKLQGSKAELDRLTQALARKSELDTEKAGLERELAVHKERLSGEASRLRKKIADELEPRAKRMPEIDEGLRAIAGEQADLAELEKTMRRQSEQAQELAARVRYLKETNASLLKDMEDTRNKFDMLEKGDRVCPLCKEPLGADGQEHLRREYEAQGLERKRQYEANATDQKSLDEKHRGLTIHLSRLDGELRQSRQRIEARTARLERDKVESERAQTGLVQATADFEHVETLIKKEDFANDERRRLARLDAEISALGYDAERHRQAREWVMSLEGYDELHRKLEQAVESLPADREALATAGQMLNRRRQEMRAAQDRRAAIEGELKALPSLEATLKAVDMRYRELSRQRDDALVKQGVLERQIERCTALEEEVGQQERQRGGLLDERSVYDELAAAFGKNGIQALVIETAIPQLQADANEILGRLTENRMSLKLQVQEGRRDSRTGLPSEELEIKIADELGTRSYETFSSGEAFRINFALRIALSRLLARRSGAPLPILFIDEGFGSLDRAGQDRLTEAIQSIQDDFQKIIVITHIEEIKEVFSARIEVTKTGSGSTFEVVQA